VNRPEDHCGTGGVLNPITGKEGTVFGLIRKRREELLQLADALIACDTTTRRGRGEEAPRDEEKIQRILAEQLESMGAQADLWEPEPIRPDNRYFKEAIDFRGRPQLLATVKGAGGGRTLLLNGHIDVVTAEPLDKWSVDPFRGTVKDGLLYGRGACDMKGPLAAIVFALKMLKEAGVRLRGDVVFCSNTDEESTGVGGYACALRGLYADGGISGEPSGFDLWVACRGGYYATVGIPGRAGHAEMPHRHWRAGGAVNPIDKLPLVLDAVRRLREDWRLRPDKQHPLLSGGDIVVTMVKAGVWEATLPSECELAMGVFFSPHEVDTSGSGAHVRREVEEQINKAAAADPWLASHPLRWKWSTETYPAQVDAREAIVEITQQVAHELRRAGRIAGLDSWHDAATFTKFAGIPTISFGPPDLEHAHTVDESVPVDDLVDYAAAIAMIAMRFCSVVDS